MRGFAAALTMGLVVLMVAPPAAYAGRPKVSRKDVWDSYAYKNKEVYVGHKICSDASSEGAWENGVYLNYTKVCVNLTVFQKGPCKCRAFDTTYRKIKGERRYSYWSIGDSDEVACPPAIKKAHAKEFAVCEKEAAAANYCTQDGIGVSFEVQSYPGYDTHRIQLHNLPKAWGKPDQFKDMAARVFQDGVTNPKEFDTAAACAKGEAHAKCNLSGSSPSWFGWGGEHERISAAHGMSYDENNAFNVSSDINLGAWGEWAAFCEAKHNVKAPPMKGVRCIEEDCDNGRPGCYTCKGEP